jgi:hypothetical protein
MLSRNQSLGNNLPSRRERYRLYGTRVPMRESSMPRILDDVLNCVVYLYRSEHEAVEGIEIGGSGFLLGVPAVKLPAPAGFTYVVTNRHVIEEKASFLRVNTTDGRFAVFPTNAWLLSNEDDLAICGIPEFNPSRFAVRTIPRSMMVTREMVRRENIGAGDEVCVIGRFINREGRERNTPTVRFGHIAQMPIEPIDYQGKSHDSFLCEVKSIGGFSGSPVFLAPISDVGRPEGSSLINEARLLGVDWAHLANLECAVDEAGTDLRHIRFATNSGMMAVAPAWKLDHLLDHPKELAMREAAENTELKFRKSPKVVLDSSRGGVPQSGDAEPNHRERFTALPDAAARKPESED